MSGKSVLSQVTDRVPGRRAVLFPKVGVRLHAMVTSAGYDDCRDPGYDWHGLRRGDGPFVLVQHTLAGRGNLAFDGVERVILPGQTLLLRFPHDNRYWLGRHPHWQFFWLCLSGREVVRLWQEMLSVAGPLVELPAARVQRLAELCLAVMDGAATSPSAASELAYAAAMCLAGSLLVPASGGSAPARRAGVARALALGEVAPRTDVTRLAAAAGLSRHHFSRVFAASEGVSPARFLLRARVERAARLLQTEGVSIKEIAGQCGFADPNYFAKVFRRVYAISPTEFRSSGAFGPVVAAPSAHLD